MGKKFIAPATLETSEFKLRPLKLSDAEIDYKTVRANREFLKTVPLHEIWKDWPPEDLSMEKELRDLKWHEDKHKKEEVFSYAILSAENYIGNVYVFCKNDNIEVYFWVTKKAHNEGFDNKLINELKKWFKEKWPLKNISFPGRE